MKNLKIIAGTSIVVLSIQFKTFEVFVGPRSSSYWKLVCIDNEVNYIFVAWISLKRIKKSARYHSIANNKEEEAIVYFSEENNNNKFSYRKKQEEAQLYSCRQTVCKTKETMGGSTYKFYTFEICQRDFYLQRSESRKTSYQWFHQTLWQKTWKKTDRGWLKQIVGNLTPFIAFLVSGFAHQNDNIVTSIAFFELK